MPVFQQAVKEGLMDAPIFTTYMRKCDASCENGGLITLGGFDAQHCGRVQGWAPVDPDTVHWRFRMQGIGAGNYQNNKPIDAITDTGPFYICLSLVNQLKIKAHHLSLVRKTLLTVWLVQLEPFQLLEFIFFHAIANLH